MPSRTWAGFVDDRTYQRFAATWLLAPEPDGREADGVKGRGYTRTFDGMNWEVEGASDIISVSVRVIPPPGRARRRRSCARGASRTRRLTSPT